MKYFIAAVVLLVAGWYLSPLFMPVDHVIEDVVMFADDEKAVLQVHLSSPIRFEDYAPAGNSHVLQIRMRMVGLEGPGRREVVSRDRFRSDVVEKTSLAAISYEGDVPGGPLLTFLFTRPVNYSVQTTDSMKTIVVEIPLRADLQAEQSRG